jgi:hypothetical protein
METEATEITAADVATVPAEGEPVAPPEAPPLGFDQVKEMVANGVKAVEDGFAAGSKEFHKQFHPVLEGAGVLDHHGFRAWRAAHSEGIDPAELDAVEATAVVDPDVETTEAKGAREAKERTEETAEAKEARKEWEAETGKTTHFGEAEAAAPVVEQQAAPVETPYVPPAV